MNEIMLDDEIGLWGISATSVIEKLKAMSGDVVVKINSPGGSVFEGITIHNALKDYDKGQVHMEIVGLAASIASYIALAGDTVKAYDNAVYMIHNAWAGAVGDHRAMRKRADILEGLSSLLAKKYISKTAKAKDEVVNLMDEESFFYGDEILAHGFCDEIVSTDNDTSKEEAVALSIETFKACVNNTNENYNDDEFVQTAAKLTKDGLIKAVVIEDEPEVVSEDTCYAQRDRELQLLEKEINL